MGMTMAEKVLARASGRDAVTPGAYVTAKADRVMAHEAFTICALKLLKLGIESVFDPERVLVILDHYFPAPTEQMARGHALARELSERFAIRHFLGHAGICHQVLTERGHILPGQLVFGSDSHSTTYGALGAAGNGIGLTEMTYVLATGELWLRVPPTIRFELDGELQPGVMSKDVMLYLTGAFGTDVAQYRAIEYAGEAAERMTIASRMTLANMGAELGAKFAFFAADERTREYLAPRVGGDVPRFGPDADARYEAVHRVHVGGLEPQIACPSNPGNVKPVSEVRGVRVHQAFLGSCTNARLEDLAVAARILRGRAVCDRTRLIVTPASHQVYLDATRAGYTEILLEAGAHITASGCGACPGGHNGVVGPGEVCLSSTNRNFRGRMGSPEADIYLASPASVAAAAVAGEIVDPREFWGSP
ncbi:MAG: 3-isopropylmalate dehydratase large subunit [Deltaproteobacteria bacterium]|nr:MAG: 3-isopropylmalate dehydratase large subunit [Deltaproteobacteria bacterium]